MSGESPYDLVVIGGGMGGLAAAALAQRLGLRTAMLEAHTKLGGCAGHFRRGPYTFDAGATALMGLRPGEPIGDLLDVLGVAFASEPTRSYRMHLPDRRLDVVTDPAQFVEASIAAFPAAEGTSAAGQRRFWRLQEAVGRALFAAAADIPRLPARGLGDLVHDLRILGPRGLLAAATSALTVQDVMNLLGLGRNAPFRAMIAMLLQDTAQAGPEIVPFANAAACLHAYRSGMSRPRGGMRALADGIGRRFAELGGDLRTATLVDRVETIAPRPRGDGDDEGSGPGFVVVTRRRHRLLARQVAFNLPLDLAARLLDRPLSGGLARSERRSRAAWSAFTGYLAIGRDAVPDETPLFHQVLQSYDRPLHDGNNVLVSLSPVEDEGYGPPTVRVATLSTHTRPRDWEDLDADAYRAKKVDYETRLLAAMARALPDASTALAHAEFASPRSFRRYTRRTAGAVGGAPVSRSNSNFLAVDPGVLGAGLWVVGDSVFPGQGTMATVLSAIRVVERITGVSWTTIRDLPAASVSLASADDSTTDRTNGTDTIRRTQRPADLIASDPCDQ
jgi:phytoene dehydrogenase-like protein